MIVAGSTNKEPEKRLSDNISPNSFIQELQKTEEGKAPNIINQITPRQASNQSAGQDRSGDHKKSLSQADHNEEKLLEDTESLMNSDKESDQQNKSKEVKGEEIDLGRILGKSTKQVKKIQQEAELLANRIALLKQEELRSWKKIQETKKKTDQILHLKKQNETRVQLVIQA